MKKLITLLLVGSFLLPISAQAALIDGLQSYWKFDESSGSAADAHGPNTLTNNNTIPYVAAKINNGADLESGSTQYFNAADSASLSFTSDMSWSFWIKPESEAGDPVIIQKWGAAGQRAYYVQLRFSVNKVRLGTSAGGTTLNEGDVTVPAFTTDGTTWYHVVVAYTASAGTFDVYTQGVNRGTSDAVDTSLADGTSNFVFGMYNEGGGNSNFYDGVLDEAGAWNKVLTSGEVTSLYNGGNGLAYPLTEAEVGGVTAQDMIIFE